MDEVCGSRHSNGSIVVVYNLRIANKSYNTSRTTSCGLQKRTPLSVSTNGRFT